ncbi:FolC bifunctional protein [Hypoxylon fuscum]|nr:FolC bifunctional protein [Hypoxylon fuscum]
MAARTYESALAHLDSIQSNRHVTSLFSAPPSSSSSSPSSNPTAADLNAQAIPEMLAWLERAGLTQTALAQNLRCVHVAGTKGKGSVCAYVTAILLTQPSTAGRVGTYTSPHLVSVRERIQLDGRPISRALFARYFFEVWDALTSSARAAATLSGQPVSDAELAGPATKPFYFRFLTILALHAFLREGVRSAVVECGIGAEHDSTNVLPAAAVTAAVVAQLGVDHVGMLGAARPRIAWHKAGVMKPARACFTRKLTDASAEDGEATMQVLRRRAADKDARLVEVDDAEVERWGGAHVEGGGLEGGFQKYNQALALRAAAEHLRVLAGDAQAAGEERLDVLAERFASGLRTARLRGRCETREDGAVTWLVDGAHTAESLEEVARWFAAKRKSLPSPNSNSTSKTQFVLLFNQQERDVAKLLHSLHAGIARELGAGDAFFHSAIFTRNDVYGRRAGEPERDLSVQRAAADAMQTLSPRTESIVVDNVSEAVERIQAMPHGDGTARVVVLATGSLHLVGALLRTLEPDGEL